MSRFLTPPEPVAWVSRWAAAKFARTCMALLKVWVWLWLRLRLTTITLGWPRALAFSQNFPYKNQKICSVLIDFETAQSRVGLSDSHKTISFLLLSAFTLIAVSPQIVNAAEVVAPTRLLIPSIALDTGVVSVGWKKVEIEGQTYGQWEVDNNLVGWHNRSAPLGQVGNTVLNGHSNVYAQVFRNLDQVEIGDKIIALAGNEAHYYKVAAKVLVQEKGVSLAQRLENGKLMAPTPDERLTLITCAFGATHRLIVIAYPDASYRE